MHGHLEIVEHVVVGLLRGLEPPVLARGERVQRQLDVVVELLGGLWPRGLVVDQLVVAAGRLGVALMPAENSIRAGRSRSAAMGNAAGASTRSAAGGRNPRRDAAATQA